LNAKFFVKGVLSVWIKPLPGAWGGMIIQQPVPVTESSGWEVSPRLSTTAAKAVQRVQRYVWNSNQAITGFMFKG